MKIAYEYIPQEYPVSIHSAYHKNSDDAGCYYHWHELIEIYYVVKGGVHLLTGNSSDWIRAGELGIVNWCEPHRSLGFEDGSEFLVVKVDIHSHIFHHSLRNTRFNHRIPGTEDIHIVMDRMVKETMNPDHETHNINLGYAAALMGLICRENEKLGAPQNSRDFQYTHSIFAFIHEHYSEKFSLQDIADTLGISKSHMCRTFMNHTGITINHYLNQTRCNAALHMISNGASVADAGMAVGFSDYNYFSRVFHKLMGFAPSKIKQLGIGPSV